MTYACRSCLARFFLDSPATPPSEQLVHREADLEPQLPLPDRVSRNFPTGFTLVELLVVLVVLGVMAGVVGLAWQPGRWQIAPDSARSSASIAAVQQRAVEEGRVIQAVVTIGERTVQISAFPDGRIVGAAALGVNTLTGEHVHADTLRH